MLVSIITVCLNARNTISHAIESVAHQSYPHVEHIVVDGGSTDGTVELVREVEGKVVKLISEPDEGIYDAMNKGLALAEGDVVGFLNADDVYFDEKVVETVVAEMEKRNVDSCYGDLVYVNSDLSKVVRYWRSSPYRPGSFKKGWHPPHPTFFVKRWVYERYGGFDTRFEISADFELMLRFLEKFKISSVYLPKPLVKMRVGGTSNRSVSNIIKGNINCYKAFKKNGLDVSVLYPFYRLLPKIWQFLARD